MTSQHKKTRTQLVVLSGLCVVGAAVLIRLLSSGPQSAPAASVGTPSNPAVALAAPSTAQPPKGPVSVTWPEEIARDPFHSDVVFPRAAPTPPPPPKVEPVVVAPAPPIDVATLAREKIHLKATVLGDRPLAMMNGRVYRAGEVVEGFKIVEIGTNQITIERDGSRLIVQVQ